MQIEVHGKNLPVTEALRSYAVKKLGRLSRWLSPEGTVDLALSVERNPRIAESQIAEATVHTRGEVLRARFAAPDMYAAVDGLVDRLRKQAQTYHDKRQPAARSHHAARGVGPPAAEDLDDAPPWVAELAAAADAAQAMPPARLGD